jgi:hypothetical protein
VRRDINPGLTMPAHHDGCAAEQRFERIFEDTMEQRNAGYESLQAAGRTRADRCPRLLNAAAWLETLAALETEFKTALNQNAPVTEQNLDRRRGS